MDTLVIQTELMRSQKRVVADAESTVSSVFLPDSGDLGDSTGAAQSVLNRVSGDVGTLAGDLDALITRMGEAADMFERLEEDIAAGFVNELTAYNV